MEEKVNYALVGLFVVVLATVLVGTLLWLTVGTEVKVFDVYRVYFRESVAGLNPKATVRYRGVEVGEVAAIELDPENPSQVKLTLRIERGTPVSEDTIATLDIQGLTGLASIELSGGRADSEPLTVQLGEPPPVIRTSPSLVARLDDAFNNVLTSFNNLTHRLETLLGYENQVAFGQTLDNISIITSALATQSGAIERTLANLETVTGAIAARSDTIGRVLDAAANALENSVSVSAGLLPLVAQVDASASAVEKMADSIGVTSRSLKVAVAETRQDIRWFVHSAAPELNNLLAELRQLANTVQIFVQELDRNPRMLLLGKPARRLGPGE